MPDLISLQPIIAQSVCPVLISKVQLFDRVEKIKDEKCHFAASGTG